MKLTIKRMDLSALLFFTGIYLKQFYLGKSGTIQISDIIIMSAVFPLLFRSNIFIQRKDFLLFLFVLCTFLVNGFYFFVLHEGSLKPCLYYIYNLIVVLMFRLMIRREEFLDVLIVVIKIILITQLMVYLSGRGRYMYGSSLRYQSTFNDPNQFGFYVICCLFFLYLCCKYLGKKVHILWYLLTGMFVVLSSSAGMVLAFSVFLFFSFVLPRLRDRGLATKIGVFILYWFAVTFIVFFSNVLLILSDAVSWKNMSFLLGRIIRKGYKISAEDGLYNFLRERQMLCIIKAPQYFLFGLGEGNDIRRYVIAGQDNEIHCTMIALWYYYGIVPYMIFILWLKENIQGLPNVYMGVIFAVIIEAFTLANHRQPFFWMIFVLASFIAEQQGSKAIGNNERITQTARNYTGTLHSAI